MLATAGPLPVRGDWSYEAKWDGMRGMAYVAGDRWRLLTRAGADATTRFPELGVLPVLLDGRPAVLDGELVAVGADGVPEFGRLQRRMPVRAPSAALLAELPVQFYVFDVLHLDGDRLVDLPYLQRRERLEALALDTGTVRTPPVFAGAGGDVLAAAGALHLEGVVAKRRDSRYVPGRSRAWIKTLVPYTTRAVVAGWVPGEGRRAGGIGALLLGAYQEGCLRYIGRVGTGFTEADLRDLHQRLAPLARPEPALADVPAWVAHRAVWTEPVLVCLVSYRSLEPDGLRHPSWRGLLDGVDPRTTRTP